MGAVKEWALEQEQLSGVAAEVAVRAGLLSRCELCEGIYDPMSNDVESAYKLGNYLISQGDPLVEGFDGDRRRLTDLLKDITQDYPSECECSRLMSDD